MYYNVKNHIVEEASLQSVERYVGFQELSTTAALPYTVVGSCAFENTLVWKVHTL